MCISILNDVVTSVFIPKLFVYDGCILRNDETYMHVGIQNSKRCSAKRMLARFLKYYTCVMPPRYEQFLRCGGVRKIF